MTCTWPNCGCEGHNDEPCPVGETPEQFRKREPMTTPGPEERKNVTDERPCCYGPLTPFGLDCQKCGEVHPNCSNCGPNASASRKGARPDLCRWCAREAESALAYNSLMGQCQTALEERDEARAECEALQRVYLQVRTERDDALAKLAAAEQREAARDERVGMCQSCKTSIYRREGHMEDAKGVKRHILCVVGDRAAAAEVERDSLRARVGVLEGAVKVYADPATYKSRTIGPLTIDGSDCEQVYIRPLIDDDQGQLARAALGGGEGEARAGTPTAP